MTEVDHSRWGHSHDFAADFSAAERRTKIVIGITAVMMVVEISGGIVFHSMAVLADGWHMSTHVCAFMIAALAYHFTRRHASDPSYSFGAGKMGPLGGFASAVVLSLVAVFMAGESLRRLFAPLPIDFNEAIGVAALALVVNGVCALLLNVPHPHRPAARPRETHHHDLNLRAAYVHVLADTFTTLIAIIALLGGKFLGGAWLDPIVGLLSSAMVFFWACKLLGVTGEILLDRIPPSSALPEEVRRAVEADGDSVVTDLHLWQVATGKFAAVVSLVAQAPKSPRAYRALFHEHEALVHLTIETQRRDEVEAAPLG